MAPVQEAINNRFQLLKLKEKPVSPLEPATDEEIDLLKRHLRSLFPTLNLEKLQKSETTKCNAYMKWKQDHCRETQYTFQVRKCGNTGCCTSQLSENKLTWLPEPQLDDSKEHYKPYVSVKDQQTDERDRP